MKLEYMDYEHAVLASIMNDERLITYIERLRESDFSDYRNKKILGAMKKLYKEGVTVDLINVANTVKQDVEVGYITAIAGSLHTTANFQEYYEQLKQRSAKAAIAEAARKIAAMTKTDIDPVELKNNALQIISDIETGIINDKDKSLANVIVRTYLDLEKKYERRNDQSYYTGIHDLDKVTGGLHEEELTVIAARPSVGKTALALQIAEEIARHGRKTLFVTREMSETQLGQRMIVRHAGIDGTRIRAGKITEEDWAKIAEALTPLSRLPIWIDQDSRTVQEIRALARELKNKEGIDLIIIDYLQLLKTTEKYQNREQEVAAMSRDTKLMALEFKIPIILLAQLNRHAEGRRPSLSDLRESGAIEQDADNVLFLYKPNRSDIEKLEGRYRQIAEQLRIRGKDFIELIIGKQRNGPVGTIYLAYEPSKLMFLNLATER